MKTLLKETGLRNIGELAKRYPKAKIYFHQDLDGVTTALAMKNYLEDNGIKVVDAEIIQYGDKEFAVKKQDATGDTMPVLVDFAHGKPMFVIHTDHHDSQSGVEGDTATSFRPSRSNVATISDVMSPKDIFPADDITLISTVDSADFAKYGLKPKDIMNFIFRLDKDKSLQKNKMALGLAANKLMLAYKNKPGFMEELVMTSKPSLLNIFQNIRRIADRENYASPLMMAANQEDYIEQRNQDPNLNYKDGIIYQYGGGKMFKPGSYDRYTPFELHPDADFLITVWPMGLVQASCNPFKKERELKGVNLGEIAQEVLGKWEPKLREKIIPLSTIKWISESSKQFGDDSVGFTNADLEAFYGKKIRGMEGGDQYMENLKQIMDKNFSELSEDEMKVLDNLGVPAWEMIQANSGGHKCITNISALNYFGRSNRPPQGGYKYNRGGGDAPYVKFAKMIGQEFYRRLREKIDQSKGGEQVVKEDMMRVGDESYSNISVNSRAQDDYIPQPLLDDIATAAKMANVNVEISYAKKGHGKTTKSGNISRHWREMAVDLSRLQDLDNPEETKLQSRRRNREGFKVAGDRLCAALESLGYNRNSEGSRNPKAVLWYMPDGSHKDHLHVSHVTDDKPKEKKVSDVVKRNLTISDIIDNGDNSELISSGSSGKGVEQIQQILVDNGYDLGTFGDEGNGVDGQFGSMTKKAIKKLQRDYDLQVDGIVGIETSKKLNELIK
jgi:hypothetical protein